METVFYSIEELREYIENIPEDERIMINLTVEQKG